VEFVDFAPPHLQGLVPPHSTALPISSPPTAKPATPSSLPSTDCVTPYAADCRADSTSSPSPSSPVGLTALSEAQVELLLASFICSHNHKAKDQLLYGTQQTKVHSTAQRLLPCPLHSRTSRLSHPIPAPRAVLCRATVLSSLAASQSSGVVRVVAGRAEAATSCDAAGASALHLRPPHCPHPPHQRCSAPAFSPLRQGTPRRQDGSGASRSDALHSGHPVTGAAHMPQREALNKALLTNAPLPPLPLPLPSRLSTVPLAVPFPAAPSAGGGRRWRWRAAKVLRPALSRSTASPRSTRSSRHPCASHGPHAPLCCRLLRLFFCQVGGFCCVVDVGAGRLSVPLHCAAEGGDGAG
jgi:hypothetical protein